MSNPNNEPTPVDDRAAEAARELLLLTLLTGRIKTETDARRLELAHYPAETKLTEPCGDATAGTVRIDRGNREVRVTDATELLGWVRDNHPRRILTRHGNAGLWALDAKSRAAIEDGLAAAEKTTGSFTDPATEFLSELERHGYTLTRVVATPDETVIDPDLWDGIVKRSKEAGEPMDANGQVVDGIEVTEAARKVVVTPTKDAAVADRFVFETAPRVLRGITGGTE